MLIDITKAIKVRLTALSISGVVSGGIHHSRAPEGTQMPYAIYAEISDNVTSGTIASRYNRALVQVDVYDDTPDEAGRMAKQLRRMLVNSNNALTNPLATDLSDGIILRIEPDGNPVAMHEGEEVYRVVQTFAIIYGESRNLRPTA